MKRLSDYQGEEDIELWADLLDPLASIFKDKEIVEMCREKKPSLFVAQKILKSHKKDASTILLTIDPTPLNGLNILVRLVEVINEVSKDPTLRSFFELSAGAIEAKKSFGSAMESTEDNQDTSSNM